MSRRRRLLRVVGDNPEDIFNDLDALRAAHRQPEHYRPKSRETFARIPHDRAIALRGCCGAAWLLLIEIDRLILKGRGRNPVRLTNRNLSRLGLTRFAKMRGLQQLSEAGVIEVTQNGRGRAPMVAHLWYPLQG